MAPDEVSSTMDRRAFLRTTGVAIGGISLAGCGTQPEEETTEEPNGSGPTVESTTTRRSTEEIRSTTTVEMTPANESETPNETPTATETRETTDES